MPEKNRDIPWGWGRHQRLSYGTGLVEEIAKHRASGSGMIKHGGTIYEVFSQPFRQKLAVRKKPLPTGSPTELNLIAERAGYLVIGIKGTCRAIATNTH
jgi:hypothetical protein